MYPLVNLGKWWFFMEKTKGPTVATFFRLDFGWKIRWKIWKKNDEFPKKMDMFSNDAAEHGERIHRRFPKKIGFGSSIHPKTGTYEFKPQLHWGFWFLAGWLVDFVWFWLPSRELKSISHLFQKENHRLKKVLAGRGWRASSQEGTILKKKTYSTIFEHLQVVKCSGLFS